MPTQETLSVQLDSEAETVALEGTIVDRDVYRTFEDVDEDRRAEFGLRAIKIGALALRDSQTRAKLEYVEREFDRMREEFDDQMETMFGEDGQVTHRLQEVFGEDGQMERRLQEFFGEDGRFERIAEEFLGEDGKLERSLERSIGEESEFQDTLEEFLGENGRLREELDREFGEEGGRLYQMLDPYSEKTPLGQFRNELEEQFDPEREGSALHALREDIQDEFQEIRHGLGIEEAVEEEKERGTQKGLEFEDVVVDLTDQIAEPFGDAVEHVGRESGPLGDVGDILATLNPDDVGPADRSIVVEVKSGRITLSGKDSIYKELDDAMQNRDAEFGIAVVESSYASRFAPLRYTGPDKLLVSVDREDEDPLELRVAYRLARSLIAARESREEVEIDRAAVEAHLEEIRSQLEHIRAMKKNLTSAVKSIEGVKDSLDEMRENIRGEVDELERKMRDGGATEEE